MSDARAVFQVSGPSAREVMAKLCPVDLSPEAFKPGNQIEPLFEALHRAIQELL